MGTQEPTIGIIVPWLLKRSGRGWNSKLGATALCIEWNSPSCEGLRAITNLTLGHHRLAELILSSCPGLIGPPGAGCCYPWGNNLGRRGVSLRPQSRTPPERSIFHVPFPRSPKLPAKGLWHPPGDAGYLFGGDPVLLDDGRRRGRCQSTNPLSSVGMKVLILVCGEYRLRNLTNLKPKACAQEGGLLS